MARANYIFGPERKDEREKQALRDVTSARAWKIEFLYSCWSSLISWRQRESVRLLNYAIALKSLHFSNQLLSFATKPCKALDGNREWTFLYTAPSEPKNYDREMHFEYVRLLLCVHSKYVGEEKKREERQGNFLEQKFSGNFFLPFHVLTEDFRGRTRNQPE